MTNRLRVSDRKSTGAKWSFGLPLSVKQLIEVVESMGRELDEIYKRLEALEREQSDDLYQEDREADTYDPYKEIEE